MADTPKPLRRGAFIDTDSDDSFLGLPTPTYGKDGHTITAEDIQKRLDSDVPLPGIPPPDRGYDD